MKHSYRPTTNGSPNLYEYFDVSEKATTEEITHGFHKALKEHDVGFFASQSDKLVSQKNKEKLVEVYRILIDPYQRKKFDDMLDEAQSITESALVDLKYDPMFAYFPDFRNGPPELLPYEPKKNTDLPTWAWWLILFGIGFICKMFSQN